MLQNILSLFKAIPHSCTRSKSKHSGHKILSMDSIPQVLLIDIVRRLGNHGFRELGSLIASGPELMRLAFDAIVLQDVDIDEYVFVSRLANQDSIYRPFLLRCLDAGNVTAQYVEGLRLAAQEGPSQRSIELIASAAQTTFMLALM